jgi:Na+-transporting NADH:ubiquinone oxidoreductase subunit E
MSDPTGGPSALVIFFAAVFTNNILLVYFLGMCSFLACSRQYETSLGLGAAVTFVMTATTILNHVIHHQVLVPLELEHLQFVVFIAVIAAFVQLVEMIVERFTPRLYYSLGIFLPLITVNCAILGASLFAINIFKYSLWQAAWYGLGSGLAFALAIALMTGLRQKMGYSNLPKAFRGVSIVMIVTGVMALAFMGFMGMASLD